MSIAMLAGLTPIDVRRTFFDDRFEPILYDAPTDLVCITVETYTARRAYQIASKYRARGVRVVLGGFHPTLFPDEATLRADSIVIGEAEPIWQKLLCDAASGHLQARYRAERPSLSGLAPDRSIFGTRPYGWVSLVETSRGCPFSCEFCSVSQFYGQRCLPRPVEEVVQDVRSLRKPIFFVDDNVGSNPERLRELCTSLLPIKRTWFAQVSLHIAEDSALLRLMRRSGCQGVLIGFESLDEGTLLDMGKTVNLSARHYDRAIRAFQACGISIYATFVFGYDNDTPATFSRVFDFALRHRFFFAAFNHLVPFPGTPLYARLAEQGRLLYPQWWLEPGVRFGDVIFQPARMSPRELAEGCERHRRRFYALSSIARRAMDFQANSRTPLKALLFLCQNVLQQREVVRRRGLPFGFPGEST